jgi:alkanesulfonate monooxygenase SsuD/methylene tetrahydromethanopterin reductase-like flavin-dependent oxidoreductase (luciferase family)
VKFGIFDHMDSGDRPLGLHYAQRLALIEAYDRLGFHAYHVAEHHSTPLGMAPSPSVFLAAAAQRTTRLRLGPLVYTLSLYQPLRLIEEICMLDQLSGGRFELGIGRGISPIELALYGVDPKKAQELFEEVQAIVLKGLTSPRLDHEGKHYRFANVPMTLAPVQRPHPPLWQGTNNPDSIAEMARLGANTGHNLPPAQARICTDAYRAAWAEARKDRATLPLMGVTRHIVVAPTDEAALRIARRCYLRWHENFYTLFREYNQRPRLIYPDTFDEMMARGEAAAGTPATVHRLLRRQIEESGINYLFCRFAFGDMTHDEALRSIELFAAEAMPALADIE